MTEASAKLARLREEHYPLMVSTLMGYIRFHGDPAIVAKALGEATFKEYQFAVDKRDRELATKAETP